MKNIFTFLFIDFWYASSVFTALLQIRIHRIRACMFLGPPWTGTLVRDTDPDLDPALDPDPFIIKQKS